MNEVNQRTCGECSVCCTFLPIEAPELRKDKLARCQHLVGASEDGYTGGRCGIQQSKPHVCAGYACLWLRGHGAESDRPDKCGVLCDTNLPIANCIQCKPIREGAADTQEGDLTIHRMSRSTGKPALVAGFPATLMARVVGRGIG